MSDALKVTRDEVSQVARMVDDLCGVVLDETKGYLIESRLGPIATEAGCTTFSELCQKAHANRTLQGNIIDAITTQETLFFRDNSPFEALKYKAIPESIDSHANTPFSKRLRIWSAACSTGQEPYSIAMTLCEEIPDIHAWDINILATDICDTAVAQASTGRYAKHEIERGMTAPMLSKYFQEESNYWRVKEELRCLIHFDRRNLLKSFTDLGPFDIIFCRNVAIYFETDVKRDLFNRLADRLTPTGYMFVGSSESLNNLDQRFVPQTHCRSVYYQPGKQATMAMA
jgi:chemotaxis protein methyltransferase CheR